MNRPLLLKVGAIGLLALLCIVPFSLVGELIGERRGLRDRVVQEIAQSSTGVQRLEGIALVMPCNEAYDEREASDNGHTFVRTRTRECDQHVLPERLKISGEIETEFRNRGIYRALAYRTRLTIQGEFKIPAIAVPAAGVRRRWEPAHLAIGIGEIRGIRNVPVLTWNDASAAFDAGAGKAPWARGIHAPVAVDAARSETIAFSLVLDLAGTERLEILPAAGELEVRMHSAWPHPSFVGRYLPDTRSVDAAGFSALWHTSDLGTNVRQAFQRCVRGKCDDYAGNAFGVTFLQTVDIYQQAYRAVHYGMLFVLLTFGVFFLYEILGGLKVHPIQYALVAAALSIFFVLLIAFSEHVPFARAYAIAACACIGLIALYVRYVLGGWRRGAAIGVLLSALYAAMYVVLGSEDYALLMGALLLFAALAAFMLLTRKLDWYGIAGHGLVHARPEEAEPASAQ